MFTPKNSKAFQDILRLEKSDTLEESDTVADLKRIFGSYSKQLGISSLVPPLSSLYPDDKNCRQLAKDLETYFKKTKKEKLQEWKQDYPDMKLDVFFHKNHYFKRAKDIFTEYLVDDLIDGIVSTLQTRLLDNNTPTSTASIPYIILLFFYVRNLYIFTDLKRILDLTDAAVITTENKMEEDGRYLERVNTSADILKSIFLSKTCDEIDRQLFSGYQK
ncbi:MAG: hypothetical protein LBG59_02520 [Candidatus Peribacteria bacterium]|jgi:hypothetical protein|nr:hypothetical protein [Candidatus Peribacteria bacterium]